MAAVGSGGIGRLNGIGMKGKIMEKNPIYGAIVAKLRTEHGWTQKELADRVLETMCAVKGGKELAVSVSPMLISAWETNRRKVSDKYAPALCELFQVEESYLRGECFDFDATELLQDDDKVRKLDEMRKEIPFDQIDRYDTMPVFISFEDMTHKPQWALMDAKHHQVITLDGPIRLAHSNKKMIHIYKYQPLYNEPYHQYSGKRLDFNSMLASDYVYVVMTSMDDVVHAMYDGWYVHNKDKTALRNAVGQILPYSGLGKSFNCYPPYLFEEDET